MCEEGSPIAFESQEGLQGRRAEVFKRSFEVSKSFKFIESHSNDSNSFRVIQSHRIQVLLRSAEQKQCCRRRGLQPSHLAALDSNWHFDASEQVMLCKNGLIHLTQRCKLH